MGIHQIIVSVFAPGSAEPVQPCPGELRRAAGTCCAVAGHKEPRGALGGRKH